VALLLLMTLLLAACGDNPADPAPPAPAAATGTPAPADEVAEALLPASQPEWIEIPALGIAQETMTLGLTADRAMEVPPDGDGIGWYDRSPTPGERGPSVLAGHINWDGRDGVFRHLGTLAAGDRVTVRRADGSTAPFEVTKVARYPKDEFPTARVYGNTRGAELRLITCSGEFDPVARSFRDNTVVYAELVG
jgi:LPXTG-site transpeptidase (sortase) family protein